MCEDTEQKKPRLLIGGFIPIENNEVPGILDLDSFDTDGEIIQVNFRRVDMTDSEFKNIPEG